MLQTNGAQVIEVVFSKEEEIRAKKIAKDIWESAQALAIAVPAMVGMNVRRNRKRTQTRKQKQAVHDRESTGEDDNDEADDEMNTTEEVNQGEDDQEEEHKEEQRVFDKRATKSRAKAQRRLHMESKEQIDLTPLPASEGAANQADIVGHPIQNIRTRCSKIRILVIFIREC